MSAMASAVSNRQNCTCAHKTLQTQWERTHGAGCTRPWFRTAEPLAERRYGNCITTTCGVFCFFQIKKNAGLENAVMALKCLSFSKIWADKFFLVCKFYSLKYKIYGHGIWTWEFSHVWNKCETGYSYIISLFKKHSVEFFILHNNIHGNFPLFGRFALKISVFLSIYICMEIQLLKKLKSTAIPSEHGKIPLFCL